MITFLNFTLAAGITITLLALVFLLKQNSKKYPQFLLIVFYLLIFFILLNLYADIHQLSIAFLISFIPHDIARWLIGPLLFLYVKSLFISSRQIRKLSCYHLLPTLFYCLVFSIPLLIQEVIPSIRIRYLSVLDDYDNWLAILAGIYTLGYLLATIRNSAAFMRLIKSNYSNLTNKDLYWVKLLLIGSVLVISFDFCLNLYQNFFTSFPINSGVFTLIAMIILIAYLGYYGIGQSGILLPKFLLKKHRSTSNLLANSSPEHINDLRLKLEQVLREKKPYLNQELTLIALAELTSTTDKKLSSLLNHHLNISFYDLINRYRVNAVKEMIDEGGLEQYTLLGIAYSCGFNSKASFNRVFKKETGISPSRYGKRSQTDE